MNNFFTPSIRRITLLWLAWFVLLYAFLGLVDWRLDIRRPDYALQWTPSETAANSQNNKPNLVDPFMNAQVSWDSEFYLSISRVGYDDPDVRTIPRGGKMVSLNYAFFPLYPMIMRAFYYPLSLFGLTSIATATLAGVIVSLLGTLIGLIALHDLVHEELGEDGALRAAFYLLIFPTGFFLASVYTEGLFIAITFSVLALSKRKLWLWASLLAALAPWVRSQGAILALPLGIAWLQSIDWRGGWREQILKPQTILQAALVLIPLVSWAIWRYGPLGQNWALVQQDYFSRGLFLWDQTINNWQMAFYSASGPGALKPAAAYYAIEVLCILVASVCSIAVIRKDPAIGWFSVALIFFSLFSGVSQSLSRYVLVAPALPIFLSRVGRNEVFDRAWTITSLLLMGMSAMLFAFDMWVA